MWNEVSAFITNLIGKDYNITAELALLSIGIGDFKWSDRTPIAHLLFAARVTIAKKWRTANPPSLRELLHTVSFQFEMERLLAYKELKVAKFQTKWSTWLQLFPDGV